MGNRHVHEIECLQRLGTSEFGRQKVTALNLFYPTASPPPLQKAGFLALRRSLGGVGHLRNVDMVTGSTSLPAGRRVIQPTCPCQHWNS